MTASVTTSQPSPRLTLCAVLLAIAACLPVLVARYPQMSDYPAHLARYYVMLDHGRSADLARWYVFQWKWSGNVGVDLLIGPFAALFGGVEAGGRVIAGLIPVLTGLGLVAVERVLRGRTTPAVLLSFAFIWSPMMLIGLLNFTLGLALALWVFAAWVRLEGKRWRWAVMLPAGLAVWLCHMSAWGVLGLMVLGYEWGRQARWRTLLAPWPLALPVLFMVGGADRLGTPKSLHAAFEAWGGPKKFVLLAKSEGYVADYGHMDMVTGPKAPEEVFAPIIAFLAEPT